MTLVLKHTEDKNMNSIEKAMFQIDEADNGGLTLKATTVSGNQQVQFDLTKIEVKRIKEYFKRKDI